MLISQFISLILRTTLTVFIWLSIPVASAQQADWTGEWDSTWRDRGARITLEQNEGHVTGSYMLYGGTIEGIADGRELRGTWKEGGRQGQFVAVMSADDLTFTARFATGEWMTGIRVISDNQFLGQELDQSLPAMTMYHFLSIMNAVGPGKMELKSEASHFIDFSQLHNLAVSELQYTQTLFSVLDRLTFRVWGIQPIPGKTKLTVTLGQAGSDVEFHLTFIKKDNKWFISPPPLQALEITLDELKQMRPQNRDLKLQGLQSPRDTLRTLVRSFMFDDGKASIELATSTLNMSELSDLAKEYEGPKLARYINRSIQRIGTPTWQEIPDDPGRTTTYRYFEHPLGSIAIGPVITEEGVIWQFTPKTLQVIRSVYAALDNFPRNEVSYLQPQKESLYFKVRDAVSNVYSGFIWQLGPMEVWQWLGLLTVLILAYALGKILNFLFYFIVMGRFQPPSEQTPTVRWLYLWSFRLLAVGVALRISDRALSFPDLVQVVIVTLSWTCIILSTMMLTLLAIGVIVRYIKTQELVQSNHMTLVSFTAGIIRMVVVVYAILLLADVLRVHYQSVLAGLGIGGLAVALAAQSTLQNFISGITLYFDKPIAVGDYCRFGEKTGTVEFIGMRSTRIRTLTRTLLTIPNSEFSNMQIENYAKRDSMFLNPQLRLRYETSPDQLRYLLVELRKLLLAHPKVSSDPLRVRFAGFGEHSLDIDVFAYVMSKDYTEFVGIREDIYLRMMQVIEQSGAKLAVPAVVHYNTEDTMPDQTEVQAGEEQIERWRQEGKLPFPDFTWQEKADMRETLDYPPVGSVLKDELDALPESVPGPK